MVGFGLMQRVGVVLTPCHGQLKPRTCEFRVRIRCSSNVYVSRKKVLEKVDEELAKGDDRAALALVKDLQGKPGGLRCFGAARQVSLVSSCVFSIFYAFWIIFLCAYSAGASKALHLG